MDFSVIIPACNEAENLKILLPRLRNALRAIDHEIVIVDNASTDTSKEVLEELQKEIPEIVIEHEPTLGYGRAVNQEKSEDLVEMYRRFREGGFDVYKAIRKNRMHDGLKRIIISKTYNLFFEIFFHTGVKDINASPKILKRGIYEKLAIESDDWFIDAEIVI